MKTELYQRIGNKIRAMGNFIDIHNCGSPTKNWPVNLYCETSDGIIIYVAKINGEWSVDYSYGETDMRSNMHTRFGMRTQREMFDVVNKILRRELK